MSRLVVTRHAPWRMPLLAIGALLFTLGGGYALYSLGHHHGFHETDVAATERHELRQARSQLEQQNTQLRERLAMLERSAQVDRQAFEEVSTDLRELQQALAEIREEVAFYRGIVSPEDSASGLRLQSFRLQRTSGDRTYRYTLILTQVLNNTRAVDGSIALTVEGILNGEPVSYPLERIAVDNGRSALAFNFRFFENLEGDILLPEGFTPLRVHVQVRPNGRGHAELSSSFDWSVEET